MTRYEDLTGQVFNYLTVVKRGPDRIFGKNKKPCIMWECLCRCGKTCYVIKSKLKNGHCTSCGCKRQENLHHELRGSNHMSWCGYEGITGTLWSRILTGAIKRNIELNITKEYIWNLLVEQNFKCKLSGLEITLSTYYKDIKKCKNTASLDRIDSSKGYIEGNVQWVHKRINYMKHTLPDNEFIYFCIAVADKQRNL